MYLLSRSWPLISGCWFLLIFVFRPAVAQPNVSEAVASVPAHSTLLKIRPVATALGFLNLAVERTVGPHSSLELGGTQSVGLWPGLRALGQVQDVSGSYRYYLLARRLAPQGVYVGPKVSYSRLANSDFLRLITLLTSNSTSNDVTALTLQAAVGYQFSGTRNLRNLVVDAQVTLGLLNTVQTTSTNARTGQPTTDRRTGYALGIPGLTFSLGYRFPTRNR